MTTKGKIVLTILLIAIAGFGVYNWWEKLAPSAKSQIVSINPQSIPQSAAAPAADVSSKLMAGDKQVSLVDGSSIPKVSGVSDYARETKDGKLIVNFPINVWPGWAPIIVANGGMEPSDNSVFFKKYGFYVKLSIVDDPVKARDLFASGHSHVLWGTLDMMALFAPELVKDSRTVPVVCQQVDWSNGGDGIVARGSIKNINDFHSKNGTRKKVVLAQNSPSHYLIMSLLLDAGIDPAEVDFKWAGDAPAAAKIFVQDKSFDAFVGWSPDIYTVSEQVPGTKLIVSTKSANHLVADVWAVRNDFYHDNPQVVKGLVRGVFEGMDIIRKDPKAAADMMAKAFGLPAEDCFAMIGKDGGIVEGDAHLTNYRENSNFFLDSQSPANFDIVWNRASTIYKSLDAITEPVTASKVKAASVIMALAQEYKDVADLSQPIFRPGTVYKSVESDAGQILTKAVIIRFEPNIAVLDPKYDTNIPAVLAEIGKLAGSFGNAYIVIEGNTDATGKGRVPFERVQELSYDRADAVRREIVKLYKFDPNKFKVVGNGWNNPVPNMTDSSNPDHNTKNRRVEVKVFPLEGN